MRVLYAVTCEHAQSRTDGRVDVEGIFHQLYAPGFPATQDHLVLALAIEWDQEGEGRREFSIELRDPSESPSLTIRGHTDVTARVSGEAPPRTLLIMPMHDVVFPRAGTHLFHLEVEGQHFDVAPLHLIEAPDV